LGGYTLVTFDAPAQTAFIVGTATVLAVNESDVKIINISAFTSTPSGRRLLEAGVRVDVSVVAADGAAAAALSATLLAVATATSALSTALAAAGLTHVSKIVFISLPAVSDLLVSAPPLRPAAASSSGGASPPDVTTVTSIVIPIVVVTFLVGAAVGARAMLSSSAWTPCAGRQESGSLLTQSSGTPCVTVKTHEAQKAGCRGCGGCRAEGDGRGGGRTHGRISAQI
jgi:hypothetical protein